MMTKIRSSKWLLVMLGIAAAFVARPLIAWAQQEVLLVGQSSDGVSRVVRTDANGNLVTSTSGSTPSGGAVGTHGSCTNTTMNVGTSGTACPPAPRSDRSSVLIQLNQSGETLRITSDGTTAATATVGAAVSSGSTYSDNLAGTVNANCRCTAATCEVVIVECP